MNQLSKLNVYNATEAFKLLNGVFCIYKPPKISIKKVIEILKGNLTRELNQLELRQPRDYIKIEGELGNQRALRVRTVPNLADHPLVVGPRYQSKDIFINWVQKPGYYTSGVVVLGVGNGCGYISKVMTPNRMLKQYEIEGQFGIATENFHVDGTVLDKSACRHVKQFRLDQVLSSIQADNQAHAFKLAGVPLSSDAAYQIASTGLARPIGNTSTLIYGMKCTKFDMPYFTLEIQCVNETEEYLMGFIHDLGLRLKAAAACFKIRQTLHGKFETSHALLQKHWTLENIIQNIIHCRDASTKEAVIPVSHNMIPV